MKRRRKGGNPGVLSRSTGPAGGYGPWLADLKQRIRAAQIRAALAVNRELIELYWDIGRALVQKQEEEGWGAKVIDRLAMDLQREFPGILGFSASNIWRMRAFYHAYTSDPSILAQPV